MTIEEEVIARFIQQYQIAVALAIVGIIAAVGVAAAWFIYEHWFTPLESKDMRRASRKKRPLLMLAGDDGYADIKDAPFSGAEGILKSKNEGRTKEHYTGALPRPQEFTDSDIDAGEGFDLTKTVAVANYVSMLANRRLLLRGAKVPIWFAYRGKAVLASLYGLAALQVVEGLSQVKELKEVFAAVDVVAIKSLFSAQWNESQINALEADAERVGELKAKRFGGKDNLIMLFAVMIIFVVVLIMLIAMAYFFS